MLLYQGFLLFKNINWDNFKGDIEDIKEALDIIIRNTGIWYYQETISVNTSTVNKRAEYWVNLINEITILFQDNKISYIGGKVAFADDDKRGFLFIKEKHLLVVYINEDGTTFTKEYQLGNSEKLV